MIISRKIEPRSEPHQNDCIGATLELFQASAGGVLLLGTSRTSGQFIVADAYPTRDLVGQDIRIPPDLLQPTTVLRSTSGIRIPLAWTVICGERPTSFLSAPIAAHSLHLVGAFCGNPEPHRTRFGATASVLSQLLAAGQQTRLATTQTRQIGSLVRHLPVPLVFVDSEGLQIFTNDEARALLELPASDIRPPSIAAALARLVKTNASANIWNALANDFRATVVFEIRRAARDIKVESRWIDDEDVSGRLWLFADVTEEKVLLEGLAKLASIDELTGVLNRRSFEAHMASEIHRARRQGLPLSLLTLDLDHFKTVNDNFGHQAGDKVLQQICRLAEGVLRKKDILARIGGEEFAVILPNTSLGEARHVAERLCAGVRAARIPHGTRLLAVTCSVGIAEFAGPSEEATSMIARSDVALYAAKRLGRDRVMADPER